MKSRTARRRRSGALIINWGVYMKKIFACLFAGLIIIGFFYMCTNVFAEYNSKIISVKGNAKLIQEGQEIEAKIGDSVSQGQSIKTGANSYVDLSLDGSTDNVIRVEEKTEVSFKEISNSRLDVLDGSIMARLKNMPKGSTFEIKSPISVTSARGTGWRFHHKNKKDKAEAHENDIFVAGFDKDGNKIGEILLLFGHKTQIDKFGGPSNILKLNFMEKNQWKNWTSKMDRKEGRGGGDGNGGNSNNFSKRLDKSLKNIDKKLEDKSQELEKKQKSRIDSLLEQQENRGCGEEEGEGEYYLKGGE